MDTTIGRLAVIRSFTVQNFRGFQDVTIEPLERVNLIAGMNNVGKTSLLEAIYLHAKPDNPRLVVELNQHRGFRDSTQVLYEICGWLFPEKLTVPNVIAMESHDDAGTVCETEMRYVSYETIREEYPEVDQALNSHLGFPNPADFLLLMLYRRSSGTEKWNGFSVCMGNGAKEIIVRRGIPATPSSQLLTSRSLDDKSVVENLSDLRVQGRLSEILSALKYLEPRLRDLSLEMVSGQPAIHASIGMGRLLPIAYLGEGIRRLLSIVVSIARCPGGIVLIDEVENGLHHSILPRVWEAIGGAARRADVQVFATTHSYECIRAAHEAFSEGEPYDLGLFRLVRLEDRIKAVAYDKETLGTSVEMNLEVR